MYQLRGLRVAPTPNVQIAFVAHNLCKILNISAKKGKKLKRFDSAFEKLSEYSITLHIVDDAEWRSETGNHIVGHYNPVNLTISIPNRIYTEACQGEPFALSVVMHELGHLVLAHQARLHFSSKPATREEDSEEQADLFSDYCLKEMGIDIRQLSFEFY